MPIPVIQLAIPEYIFTIKTINNHKLIFDIIRKKYVALTPEEWVRQNIVRYLINEKKYSSALIALEQTLEVNKTIKRCDIVVYNSSAQSRMIVECKAQTVQLTQSVYEQTAIYNSALKVEYLVITNGTIAYCSQINEQQNSYIFLNDFPDKISINQKK